MDRCHLDFATGTAASIRFTLPVPKSMRWVLHVTEDGECYAVDTNSGTVVHLSEHCKRDHDKANRVVAALNRIYRQPASR